MSHLLQFDLDHGISHVPAGHREAVGHLPIVLLFNHHQENEEPI
jgi:hypothetical protein